MYYLKVSLGGVCMLETIYLGNSKYLVFLMTVLLYPDAVMMICTSHCMVVKMEMIWINF